MLNVRKASKLGFCFGAKRSVELALKEKNAYCLGPLLHNSFVLDKLKEKGIKIIEDTNGLSNGKIIIRAHGVPNEKIKKIKDLGLEIVDLTCPYVKKVQNIAKEYYDKGDTVIVFGDEEHPEVKGVINGMNMIVVSSLDEAKKLDNFENAIFISQTTNSKKEFNEISKELKKHCKELKIFNTICNASVERQEAAKKLAKEVELMVVIGDKRSANTNNLYEICGKITKTVKIESSEEVKEEWRNFKNIGITAGASTPDEIIDDVVKKLNSNL